jgi:2',3'-cyclic-nucleotide 2'-phosphodiesterase (5'-nucleotidase family)
MVAGVSLDLSATYRLATNDYMGRGGDGYSVFTGATALIDSASGEYMASQLMNYIEAAGSVAPTVEGRIKVSSD